MLTNQVPLLYSMLYVPPPYSWRAGFTHTCAPKDAHAIYLLNLLLAFLQPRFDPSIQEDILADEIEGGGENGSASPLPSQRDDEFRPFVRRLPEWQFWCVLPASLCPASHPQKGARGQFYEKAHER